MRWDRQADYSSDWLTVLYVFIYMQIDSGGCIKYFICVAMCVCMYI